LDVDLLPLGSVVKREVLDGHGVRYGLRLVCLMSMKTEEWKGVDGVELELVRAKRSLQTIVHVRISSAGSNVSGTSER
jgi:hypothetical protein